MAKKLKEDQGPQTGKTPAAAPTGNSSAQKAPPVQKSPQEVPSGRSQRALSQELDQAKRSIVVQSPKGAFKIEKLHDNMFNVFQSTFSKQMGIKKDAQSQYQDQYTLSKDDVVNLINQSAGKDYNITLREATMKKSGNIIKKDLLRRKIKEYFSKNPTSKSVVISSNVAGNKTVWKVQKCSKGFNVVEVNARKEQFVMIEAPATTSTASTVGTTPTGGSQEFQQVMKIMTPIMGNLGTNQSQAAQARNQVNALMGKIRSPQEKTQAGAMLNYLGALTGGNMAATAPNTPISTAPGAVPTPSTMTGLTSSKKVTGKKLHEKDEKKDDKPKKKDDGEKKSKQKTDEPEDSPKDLEPVSEPTSEPIETGIETGSPAPEEPPESLDEPETPDQAPKTGEEMQLKQVTQSKPIQNLDIFGDDAGGHLILSLGGLKNPIQFNFGRDGKITYKIGELSRVLKMAK